MQSMRQKWMYFWNSLAFYMIQRMVAIRSLVKVMLKMLQARLQQYVNRELPDVQTGFRKGRGIRDQIPITIVEKKEVWLDGHFLFR